MTFPAAASAGCAVDEDTTSGTAPSATMRPLEALIAAGGRGSRLSTPVTESPSPGSESGSGRVLAAPAREAVAASDARKWGLRSWAMPAPRRDSVRSDGSAPCIVKYVALPWARREDTSPDSASITHQYRVMGPNVQELLCGTGGASACRGVLVVTAPDADDAVDAAVTGASAAVETALPRPRHRLADGGDVRGDAPSVAAPGAELLLDDSESSSDNHPPPAFASARESGKPSPDRNETSTKDIPSIERSQMKAHAQLHATTQECFSASGRTYTIMHRVDWLCQWCNTCRVRYRAIVAGGGVRRGNRRVVGGEGSGLLCVER